MVSLLKDAALVIRLWGNSLPHAAYWLGVSSLCAVALAALTLFGADGKYTGMLVGGQQNCL